MWFAVSLILQRLHVFIKIHSLLKSWSTIRVFYQAAYQVKKQVLQGAHVLQISLADTEMVLQFTGNCKNTSSYPHESILLFCNKFRE